MDQFSPAELTEIIFLARSSMDTQFQFWVSITFAAVVAGFIAGDRLTQRMRYVAASLYALAALVLILRFFDAARTVVSVGDALREAGVTIFPGVGPVVVVLVVSRYLLFGLGTAAALYFLVREKPEPSIKPLDEQLDVDSGA